MLEHTFPCDSTEFYKIQNAETKMDLSGSDSASTEVSAVFLLLLWELIHVLLFSFWSDFRITGKIEGAADVNLLT